ncbi:MAG TPA: hypothetical protein VII73_04065 [Caulobacteraceae bacterium]
MNYDPELIGALEPGQFTAVLSQALPPRKLGRGVVALLFALRTYVIIAVPTVGYAFAQALVGHHP